MADMTGKTVYVLTYVRGDGGLLIHGSSHLIDEHPVAAVCRWNQDYAKQGGGTTALVWYKELTPAEVAAITPDVLGRFDFEHTTY